MSPGRFLHCLARALRAVALASFLGAGPAWSSDTPESFPDTNGVVYAALVSDDILYIGGSFTDVDGVSLSNIAAIDLTVQPPAVIDTWNPSVDDAVRTLAVSANGSRIYLGGDFTTVGGGTRNHIAAVNAADGALISSWDPNASGTVRAIAVSPDGDTLYVGGDFTSMGGTPRNYVATIQAATSALTSWAPQADATVRALEVAADGASVYAGGDFNVIGGQVRSRLAELQAVNAKATAWDPSVTGISVHDLLLSDTTLYVGGDFTAVDGSAPHLAALDTTQATPGSIDTGWAPDPNGAVRTLALTGDGMRLYAGGDFTNVKGGAEVRDKIAGFLSDTDTPTSDVIPWDPSADSMITSIEALVLSEDSADLYVGGDYTRIGARDLTGITDFTVAAPVTAADFPGGGYDAQLTVTLTCTDPSNTGDCTTYFTIDGSEPTVVTADEYIPGTGIDISGNLTLKYFSVDTDGNIEPVNTAVYVIDGAAPTTDVNLLGDIYGIDTLETVELTCNDDNIDLGCTTYFTLTVDGTLRTNNPEEYNGPFSLADLFPPPGVGADEVDPLFHLAGTVELSFYSVDDAGNEEALQTETYTVDLSAPFVTPSLPSGNYISPTTISLNCDDGVGSGCAEMYYTTDDTPPSDGVVTDDEGIVIPVTERYTGPLTLTSGVILRVLAVDEAGNKASNTIGIYSFTQSDGDQDATVGRVDALLLWMLVIALAWRLGRMKRED